MASINYSGLKKVELITIARRKKAPVTASMNKNEIIKAIKKAVKSKAQAKAKPVSKSKAKARPVKKTGTKAKPSKKAKAAKTTPVKKAKAKAKIKAKTKVVAEVKAKAKVKTPTVTKTKVKAKIKKVSGSTAKKNKSVVSKPAKPSTPAKKKAVSAKKAVNKPAKKVSRPAVVKEQAPKPVSKKRAVSAKKTSIGKPSSLAVIKEPPPPPVNKKKDRKDWDIPINAGKFFTADEQGGFSPEDEAQLPDSYGEDRIVALPKDPRSLFVYWEVLETSCEAARRSLGKSWRQVKWILRVSDVTGLSGVEEAYHNFFDVTIDPEARRRYLDVNGDGREYIVELGLTDDDNRFSSICLSNRAQTPRAGLSAGDKDFITEDAQALY
ncbi:MAG TPA: DUF4912 domain-containing protein, partial [Nitrospirae bacterium]|nr:DUF4912 domain-containing protein [Nitrospirota bacterium]